ncbi:hypothetical protein DPSP01_000624 [Paraphaeosphaeria sporulosa]
MYRHERPSRDPMSNRLPLQPRWPENARYAPNCPIYPLKATPAPAPVPCIDGLPFASSPYAAAVFTNEISQYFARTSLPPRPIQLQTRRKISIPKKQVHFNLTPRSPPQNHPPRRASQVHLPEHGHRGPPTPANPPRKRPSTRNIAHQPTPPSPSASHPTIWIVTYAHSLANTPAVVNKILASQLPHATLHLYTIHAYNMTPPPVQICDAYSGISPIVQDYVMRDPHARKAVDDAIHNILAHGQREMRKEKEGKRPAKKDFALSVCCMYGTHRSVSIAEKIAQGLMGMKLGLRVVVRHVHRVKGAKDPR